VNPYADILSAVTVLDTSHLTSNGATFSASYSSGGFTTSTEIGLTATDQSTVSINDGTLQTFISSGGFCTDTAIGLKAMSSATVQVSGGTFGGFASSGGDSTDISCGLLATDNSTVFITGGHFRDGGPASSGGSAYADIIAAGASKVSITGGSFAGLLGQNNAQVTIYGSGFNYPAGGVRDLTGTITGTLQDGETLNLSFIQDRAGQIVLSQVPEPAAVSLLRTCVALSVRRRSGAALGSMNFEHWS
jgi:hypothetical protein